jgi:cytoskeletal protein CcmA (bactofilin family)
MWKTKVAETPSTPLSRDASCVPGHHPSLETRATASILAGDRSTLGKGLTFVGRITASEPLLIAGSVKGSINLPGHRVTVGPTGQVTAGIYAREIVVLGSVCGNVTASKRVEICADGSVTGDIATPRICIEDGAFFKGTLDVLGTETCADLAAESVSEPPKPRCVVLQQPVARKQGPPPLLQSA